MLPGLVRSPFPLRLGLSAGAQLWGDLVLGFLSDFACGGLGPVALGLYERVLFVGSFGMSRAGSTPCWPVPSSGHDAWDRGSRLDCIDSEGAPWWGPLVWDRDRCPFEKLKEAEGALSTRVALNIVFTGFVNPQKYLR